MTVIPEVRADLERAIRRSTHARRRRLGAALAIAGTLVVSGTAVAATGWNPLADKLVAQPTVNFRQPGTQYTPSNVRAAGEKIAATIPTPPGHPIDVNWDASGGDNAAGLRSVAEYNASCQWYRFALERTPSEQTLAVIASMERWPSFRGTFKATTAATIAKDLANGNTDSTKRQYELNCR